jgi:hypothetical protein
MSTTDQRTHQHQPRRPEQKPVWSPQRTKSLASIHFSISHSLSFHLRCMQFLSVMKPLIISIRSDAHKLEQGHRRVEDTGRLICVSMANFFLVSGWDQPHTCMIAFPTTTIARSKRTLRPREGRGVVWPCQDQQALFCNRDMLSVPDIDERSIAHSQSWDNFMLPRPRLSGLDGFSFSSFQSREPGTRRPQTGSPSK